MTSKRRKWLLIISCLIGIVALMGYFVCDHEPSYQGKSLSEWVTIDRKNFSAHDPARAAAMQHFGTNALPFLLQWMHASPTTKGAVHAIKSQVTNLPPIITPTTWRDWARRDQASDRAIGATFAIGDSEELALAALPELTAMMNATNAGSSSYYAVTALANIGEAAIPVLTAALANTNHQQRMTLIQMFGGCPALCTNASAATSAIPLLAKCIANDEKGLRSGLRFPALEALERMAQFNPSRADVAVPALEKCLSPTNESYVRLYAMTALGAYGTSEPTALPILVQTLSDPDEFVRTCATNVLRKAKSRLRP